MDPDSLAQLAKEAARQRRLRKPKPGFLEKYGAQDSPFFELPREIRNQIYSLVFMSMENEQGRILVTFQDWKKASRTWVPDVKLKQKYDKPAIPILDILLICKQISYEANQIFWSKANFYCYSPDVLMHFCEVKQLPHHRPKKNLPRLFHIEQIRHLEYFIHVDLERLLDVVKGLWTLAQVANIALEPKIILDCSKKGAKPLFISDAASLLRIYRRMQRYQVFKVGRGKNPVFLDFWFRHDSLGPEPEKATVDSAEFSMEDEKKSVIRSPTSGLVSRR